MEALRAQFEALDKKIRYVLILGITAALYLLFDTFLIQPHFVKIDKLKADIKKSTQLREKQEKEIITLSTKLNPRKGNGEIKKIDELKQEITQVEKNIQYKTELFISAQNMIGFLQEVFNKNDKLTLVSLEKLPVQVTEVEVVELSLDQNKVKSKDKATSLFKKDEVFKHAVEIVLSGKYADIVHYLYSIENLPWRVFWESVELVVDEYPISKVTVTLYTVSMNESWLTL